MSILQNEGEFAFDDPWLIRCRAREEAAWSDYFTAYQPFVRRVARRLGVASEDVDDVVQDVFTTAFRHIDGFKQGRMTTWLFRLTSNAVSNRQRSRRVREAFSALLGRQVPKLPRTAHDQLEAHEAQEAVQGIIAKLSPKRRDVFALFELEGLSGDEIAQLLDLKLGTVWTRLHHARKDFERMARKEGLVS